MASDRAIKFADGVIVEIAASKDAAEPVSGSTNIVRKFEDSVKQIREIIGPIITDLSESMAKNTKEIQIELAMGFAAEGSILLCKTSGEASLKVTVTMKGPADV
jgi:Trypsin-co-occurring domain 1